jgi:hypothetical protein
MGAENPFEKARSLMEQARMSNALVPKQVKFFGILCGKGGGFSGADFSGSSRLAG